MSIANGHVKLTQESIAAYQSQVDEIRDLCRRAVPHNNKITPLIADLDNQVLSPNARKQAQFDLESRIIVRDILSASRLAADQIEKPLGELSLLLNMIDRMEKIGDVLQTQYKEEKAKSPSDSQRLECLRLACNFTTKYVCLGCSAPTDTEDSRDCNCKGGNITNSQGQVSTWNNTRARRLSPAFPPSEGYDRPQYPGTFSYMPYEWNERHTPEMLKRTRPYYTLAAMQDAASTVEGPEIDFNNTTHQYLYMIQRRDELWRNIRKVISSVSSHITWIREKLEAGV